MDYFGFATGVSQIPQLWQHGVHAFPDLATGSPEGYPALSLVPFSNEKSGALKLYGGTKSGNLGLEWQLGHLGNYPMGFNITGDFGTAFGRTDNGKPIHGKFYERGNFDVIAPALSGTYTKNLGDLSLMGKLGLAMPVVQTNTLSSYDLGKEGAGNIAKQHGFISLSPLLGISAIYPINKNWKARLEAEHYKDVKVSNSADPAYNNMKKAGLNSIWLGLERSF